MKLFFPFLAALLLLMTGCSVTPETGPNYLHVAGAHILDAEGDTFFIRGTNLGNWLNPEGYMFRFRRCNAAAQIDQVFCQLIGPDETARFWQRWKEEYITEDDICFIAATGANTIRLPFHYKLFTTDYYLGNNNPEEGFIRMDSTIAWCRRHHLRLILDMHDAPGGQTGDNIDDSYGYPWLMVSETSRQLFVDIWTRIAERYHDEPVILGYELINEPIAHYFQQDLAQLNAQLEPLYKRTVAAIRKVDQHHIILLGGAQWNGTFRGVFTDWHFDDNIMWTCHRYGQPSTLEGIQDFIDWRDSTQLCMYMGETGHNTLTWVAEMCSIMSEHNIGYTFWPYKKMAHSEQMGQDGRAESWLGFDAPDNWQNVMDYAEADHYTYFSIRDLRGREGMDYATIHKAIFDILDNCPRTHCRIDTTYIRNMQLRIDAQSTK
ncbi:MAG: glycoside hydrolase family 5 protein [Paludibacteraceae bacterium]|nr:glycoside hydrolase family 5 protein [Paludibacteraceae bacterium]